MAPLEPTRREVSFLTERHSDRTRTVTASLSGGNLVFNDGTYYPRMGSSESREVDDYATVAKQHLPLLLAALLRERPDALMPTAPHEPAPGLEQQLLLALAAYAQAGAFASIDAIQRWLTTHQIPFRASSWIDID